MVKDTKESNSSKKELERVSKIIMDPLALELIKSIKWISLNNISNTFSEQYPVVIIGKGKPILLLHGFDSCFMEFRRLAPFLINKYQLIIPDLFGFGFCPRPKNANYDKSSIISHLTKLINELKPISPIGIIGASMGGGIALDFAKENINLISNILLLSPAGLAGSQPAIPPPLNYLGVYFLRQKFVREKLCENAFFNSKDAGSEEKQIASIHLDVPGWGMSLAAFASSGGVEIKEPLPNKVMKAIWGKEDKILNKKVREKSQSFINCCFEELDNCGHLPHIDHPKLVAEYWERLVYE